MLFKLSFFILILTTPFMVSGAYYSIPYWVIISLGFTTLYAIFILFAIDLNWESQGGEDG